MVPQNIIVYLISGMEVRGRSPVINYPIPGEYPILLESVTV